MGLIETGSPKLPKVITSFNEAGYQKYGKAFLASWKQHAPPRIPLTIYYEGDAFDFEEGFSWHPVEEVEFLADYMSMLQFPLMHGIVGSSYDVWFDARHGRKVFMQAYAIRKYGGKVFWLDADSVFQADMPENFFDRMLPDDKLACYLGRDGWYFTESGFIGFNAKHPSAKTFVMNYVQMFMAGTFLANAVHGRLCWNDCGGFDAVRHVMGDGEEFVNLAAGVPKGTMHPFVNVEVGKYITHLKGNRKETGKLEAGDLIQQP
jgi:hypothetical protein